MKLYTIGEAAKILGVSRPTAYKWDLPPHDALVNGKPAWLWKTLVAFRNRRWFDALQRELGWSWKGKALHRHDDELMIKLKPDGSLWARWGQTGRWSEMLNANIASAEREAFK